MNEKQHQWALGQKTGEPMMKFVLLNLAFHAEGDEFVCPTIETLSNETQLDQAAVQGHLAELKKQGYLKEVGDDGARLAFVRAA